MDPHRQIRVAIVGSGLAGLVTAYLLHRDIRQRYAVKLFESGTTISLDAASVTIRNASAESKERIDLPMRAFAGGYYKNLKAMYDHLGIKYHSQPFLFEFAQVQPEHTARRSCTRDTSHFVHASNLHMMPPPRPPGVATFTYLLEIVYLLVCYAYFTACCFLVAPRSIRQGDRGLVAETLDQYLKRIYLPEYFVNFYLLPLMSSVATCPHKQLLTFPASDLVEYKKRTHGAPHYTVFNGVHTVQERLAKGLDYELSATITAVERHQDGVTISWRKSDDGNGSMQEENFDRVVLAVAPDIVGSIFEPLQRSMEKIPTALVESVVHTDQRMIEPELRQECSRPKRSSQLILLRTLIDGTHRTESMHVQPCGAIVTTCPFSPIDPSLTVQSAKFTRVMRSSESKEIVNSIFSDTPSVRVGEKSRPSWRNGDDNVWLVGGWCWDGMVLLEGCIVSAMRIADAFDVDVPWRRR